jgi:hypothetical protein
MGLSPYGDGSRLTRGGLGGQYGFIHDAETGERPPKAAEHGHGAMQRWIGGRRLCRTINQPTLVPSTEAVDANYGDTAVRNAAHKYIVNRMTQQAENT